MRVGLNLDPSGDPADVPAAARRAEELGYDLVSSGEHVFFHGPMPNAFVTLAAAAAVTERVRLVTSLTILPLYPLALAAKLAAQVDRLSGGRLELGIGVGGEFAPEFAAVGADIARRGRDVDEALPVLIRLLSGETVTAGGAFGRIDAQRLDPPPAQLPPPLWVGGRSLAAARRAGRYADLLVPYLLDPPGVARRLTIARHAAEREGRDPAAVRGALFAWGSVDDDAARARREVVEAVSRTYRQDMTSVADRYLLHGTADDVTARLADYADAGVETVLFAPAGPPGRRAEVVRRFAVDIAPRLRE